MCSVQAFPTISDHLMNMPDNTCVLAELLYDICYVLCDSYI